MRRRGMVELRILGPLEVAEGDNIVPLPAAKHRRLLAALALARGRTCSVDELLDAVWGESPPASARKLLQVYVSALRKVLPEGATLVTQGPGYALLLPAESLDAERFEAHVEEAAAALASRNPALAASLADRALALWRGAALADVAYDDFARAEAERLEELRVVALEQRVESQLLLGRDVLAEALALAREQPLRERSQALAMHALYRSRRQTEALDLYAAVRARLRRARPRARPGPPRAPAPHPATGPGARSRVRHGDAAHAPRAPEPARRQGARARGATRPALPARRAPARADRRGRKRQDAAGARSRARGCAVVRERCDARRAGVGARPGARPADHRAHARHRRQLGPDGARDGEQRAPRARAPARARQRRARPGRDHHSGRPARPRAPVAGPRHEPGSAARLRRARLPGRAARGVGCTRAFRAASALLAAGVPAVRERPRGCGRDLRARRPAAARDRARGRPRPHPHAGRAP